MLASLVLVKQAFANKDVRSPPSVLLDDDPCGGDADNNFHCGNALLQSGNWRTAPRKAALVEKKAQSAVMDLETLYEIAAKASQNASAMDEFRRTVAGIETPEAAVKQSLLEEHLVRISVCDEDLRKRLETEKKLADLYHQWMHLHKVCDSDALALHHKLQKCQGTPAEKTRENQSQNCSDTQKSLREKMAECGSVRSTLRSTGCARATQASESCSAYSLCRAGLASAFLHAKGVMKAIETDEPGSQKVLFGATVRCLRERLSNPDFEHSGTLEVASACRRKAQESLAESSMLQDPPPPMECNPRSEEQRLCTEEDPDAERSVRELASEALDKELSREVTGVSFMQEGIERADAIPRDLHKIFMDSTLPIPMLLTFLTLLMLWVRCTAALPKREMPESSTPSTVDAWCVHQGAQEECDGKWLCQELMVPKRSKCTVTVPRMLKEGPSTALVVDKMGQCMFKATAEACGQGLKLKLARQDGVALAACQISFEGGGSCQVLEGDAVFASLQWENAQARSSWFQWPSAGPGAFVLRNDSGVLLQVAGSLDGRGGLQFQDAFKRSLAQVMLSRASGGQEALQVEVWSETATDLGLVVISLLAIDRLQVSRSP